MRGSTSSRTSVDRLRRATTLAWALSLALVAGPGVGQELPDVDFLEYLGSDDADAAEFAEDAEEARRIIAGDDGDETDEGARTDGPQDESDVRKQT